MRTISWHVDRIEDDVIVIISESTNNEFTVEISESTSELKEKDWVLISLKKMMIY